MFDRNDRPLKREYETLGWLDLPELGTRNRSVARRPRTTALMTIGALLAALAIAIAAAS